MVDSVSSNLFDVCHFLKKQGLTQWMAPPSGDNDGYVRNFIINGR